MERRHWTMAGAVLVLAILTSALIIDLYGHRMDDDIARAQAEIRTLQWSLAGTSYTVQNLSLTTVAVNDNGNVIGPNPTPIRLEATVFDDTVTAHDPAVIQLSLHNTANTSGGVSNGEFWPFDIFYMEREDGHTFLLFSEEYEDILGWEMPGYTGLSVIPAPMKMGEIGPGEVLRRNHTIASGIPGVRPGNYTVTDNMYLHHNDTDPELRYELSFQLK